MSRIGREPVAIPAGVTVSVAEGNVVTVKGALGELSEAFCPVLGISVEGSTLTVTRPNDDKEIRALHGLTRAKISNMVVGVTTGFAKKLEIVGVGYKAEKQGKKLDLNLGHSHPIYFEEADGIVINPGAYTHTSIALLDAVSATRLPTVAVHISKVEEREDFRQVSYIRLACVKTITGHGTDGYTEGIEFLYNGLTGGVFKK